MRTEEVLRGARRLLEACLEPGASVGFEAARPGARFGVQRRAAELLTAIVRGLDASPAAASIGGAWLGADTTGPLTASDVA
jgi:hypothetical protein